MKTRGFGRDERSAVQKWSASQAVAGGERAESIPVSICPE
jgi:hypothetical protein